MVSLRKYSGCFADPSLFKPRHCNALPLSTIASRRLDYIIFFAEEVVAAAPSAAPTPAAAAEASPPLVHLSERRLARESTDREEDENEEEDKVETRGEEVDDFVVLTSAEVYLTRQFQWPQFGWRSSFGT